jgi:hypothetical protein
MELAVNIPEHDPQVGQAFKHRGEIDGLSGGGLAGFHGSAGHEHRRDIDPRDSHHHAGNDLVAIGDADHAVETMGAEHGFHAIGDQFATGQGILHAHVPHGDAVVDADGVEFKGNSPGGAHGVTHFFAHHVQMGMARDNLHKGIADRDKRFIEIGFGLDHAGRAQQTAMGSANHAFFDGIADGHGNSGKTTDRGRTSVSSLRV